MDQLAKLSSLPGISALRRMSIGQALCLSVAANAVVLGSAWLLINCLRTVYTSRFSVVVLRGGSKPRVSLHDIGSASAETKLPPTQSLLIKASYRAIAATDAVLQAAAAKVGVSPAQFGKPQIITVESTPLIEARITGASPEEAQKKAEALYQALQERLNRLRVEQAATEEAGFETAISLARKRLQVAQQQLSNYKLRSGLISEKQLEQVAASIEDLRRLRAELLAQQRDSSARQQQLSQIFSLSSPQASDALTLQSDPLFQKSLQENSEATADLTTLRAKLGPNHPRVVAATARQTATQAALQAQVQTLLGRSLTPTALTHLNPGVDASARSELFSQIITTQAEQAGLTARAREIDRQIADFEQQFKTLAQSSSTLEALNRDMHIAEAVFTSTLGGLDASKMDIFGAYPPIELLEAANRPEKPEDQLQLMILLSAAALSILLTTALLLLASRQTPFTQRILRQCADWWVELVG